ncbi:MAG: PdxA family protein [Sandaracinaceae bacterium]
MKPLLVPVGDPCGVGPAIAVEAALEMARTERVVLFGDAAHLRERAGDGDWLDAQECAPAGLSFVDCGPVAAAIRTAHRATPEGGAAQLAALDAAIEWANRGDGRAIVTGPTSKEAIALAGTPFTGQTEHLARAAGLPSDAVTMMFLGPRLRVALATTHVGIRRLPEVLESKHVSRAIRHLVEALARLGHKSPRVVVGALNPHAGEARAFGDEDEDVVRPGVDACRPLDAELIGPIGAETAFRRAASAEVDGVVAMFHDQATIASKLLDWGEAVNVTWGLPFLRTSVDHGVAYDAAAKDAASPDGMRAALRLAVRLTQPEDGRDHD